MRDTSSMITELSTQYQELFQRQNVILPFDGFLELVRHNPRNLIRSSAEYIRDVFDYFGTRDAAGFGDHEASLVRFKLFDKGSAKNGPIIGGEMVQDEVYNILQNFVRQGFCNKLILLHGPNGSAKSSTVEAIGHAMSRYSETDHGAAYRFNWIFPNDKTATPKVKGEAGPIGFGAIRDDSDGMGGSYAHLDDTQIASKIHSEFKDNPIFLIPMPQREVWLREWIAEHEGIKPEDVELPPHILQPGLSKRNQMILENLLSAYDGDLGSVLRHVQVERFFYSRQYRVGIASVEPQMAVDAQEKQLTMDRYIQNLPSVLQNIRYFEAQGELVEANRGLLEFSDLLKRPVDAYKYLLSTVENSAINLPSSTANLDVVFMATSNEKHLDAFKTTADFSSFRGRFELVTVPYLLKPSQEKKIYNPDLAALSKKKTIAPHTLDLLCIWTVMTRLKQPDPECYDSAHRGLIARLDPRSKIRLYENEDMSEYFKPVEATTLKELRTKIMTESVGLVVYEGRFGASPREVRAILQRAAQNPRHETLTPMAVFEELERLVRERTVYEFLQFEPRGKYHDSSQFIRTIKQEFAERFEDEVLKSMSLVAEEEYDKLLSRYVDHAVASVKKEKLYNPSTEQYEPPSETVMKEVEKIIGVQGSVERHREAILSRIAAHKLDNPDAQIDVSQIFSDFLKKIEDHYYNQRKSVIDQNYRAMLALGTDEEKNINREDLDKAEETYSELERRFGYDRTSSRESLKFMLKLFKEQKK